MSSLRVLRRPGALSRETDMHICPVCTAAAIQVVNDNMPVIWRLWSRLRCWVRGLLKKSDPHPKHSELDVLV